MVVLVALRLQFKTEMNVNKSIIPSPSFIRQPTEYSSFFYVFIIYKCLGILGDGTFGRVSKIHIIFCVINHSPYIWWNSPYSICMHVWRWQRGPPPSLPLDSGESFKTKSSDVTTTENTHANVKPTPSAGVWNRIYLHVRYNFVS
jgi:hypothetical protein